LDVFRLRFLSFRALHALKLSLGFDMFKRTFSLPLKLFLTDISAALDERTAVGSGHDAIVEDSR
jgi:hypothetical protein